MKVAIVDIDCTLWDFCSVLYSQLKIHNPLTPVPSEWHDWSCYETYVPKKLSYKIIEEIHINQHTYDPFEDSKILLNTLRELDYYIIIASHRKEKTRSSTLSWLYKHELEFDRLHISFDKSVLFSSCNLFIDDSPFSLQKAYDKGVNKVLGISMPYNKHITFIPMFNNLSEVVTHLTL